MNNSNTAKLQIQSFRSNVKSERGGGERPGCDGKVGSAGELCRFGCLCVPGGSRGADPPFGKELESSR